MSHRYDPYEEEERERRGFPPKRYFKPAHSADFDAIISGGKIYCVECAPDGVIDAGDFAKIQAGQMWSYVPVCVRCGYPHRYMEFHNKTPQCFACGSSPCLCALVPPQPAPDEDDDEPF